MTTNEITDSQILNLRIQAAFAGDEVQQILCDVAMFGAQDLIDAHAEAGHPLNDDGSPDYSFRGFSPSTLRGINRALTMTREEARAECAKVIVAATARASEDV